jgi:MoxR-like ATPase
VFSGSGVEKAEQNVLPTLNNLLENREMALEDGRFLMHPVRFDSLLRTHTADELASKGLIRVHPNFRVIALGTPVPFFPGLPLDPPLRSRFQARNIQFPKIDSSVDGLIRTFPNVHVDLISKLVTFVESLRHLEQNHSVNQNTTSRYPHFTSDPSLLDLLRIVSLLPANIARSISEIPFDWFVSVYPFPILCGSVAQRESLSQIMIKFKLISDEKVHPPLLNKVSSAGADANELMASFSMAAAEFGIRIREAVPVSHGFLLSKNFVETSESRKILSSMLFSYTIGRSLALVGDKGVGKSVLARHFCNLIGYFPVEFIYLFKDMTTRELLQRRSTDSDGNTKWTLGPLARAAIEGRVCVLDGLDRLTSATASTLSQLLLDGELNLFDGTRLLRHDRYQALIHSGLSEATLLERGIKPVHPMFRCIALALAPTSKNQWLSAEIQTLFSWHLISSSSKPNQFVIVHNRFPDLPVSTLNLILDLSEALEKLSNSAISLSNRQLIRIAAHVQKFGQSELGLVLGRVLLLPLLPTTQRNIVNEVLSKFGISNNSSMQTPVPELIVNESHVKLGGIQLPRANPKEPALVPSIVFFNIPQHMLHLQDLMKDWICQEKYLLLIGTQGVGKNKLADRMMELLRLEREYMQLHRDTSIAQLTTMPSMENGKVIYVDSPLVRAAIHGRILLLDECDKAPLEVVCILKGLIEDGQLLLSDGRRLIDAERFQLDSRSQADDSIPIHPNFRCILLANKAGWPFLGLISFSIVFSLSKQHIDLLF